MFFYIWFRFFFFWSFAIVNGKKTHLFSLLIIFHCSLCFIASKFFIMKNEYIYMYCLQYCATHYISFHSTILKNLYGLKHSVIVWCLIISLSLTKNYTWWHSVSKEISAFVTGRARSAIANSVFSVCNTISFGTNTTILTLFSWL